MRSKVDYFIKAQEEARSVTPFVLDGWKRLLKTCSFCKVSWPVLVELKGNGVLNIKWFAPVLREAGRQSRYCICVHMHSFKLVRIKPFPIAPSEWLGSPLGPRVQHQPEEWQDVRLVESFRMRKLSLSFLSREMLCVARAAWLVSLYFVNLQGWFISIKRPQHG